MAAEPVATARYARSSEQIERARRCIPGGVATAMRAAQRPVPLVIDRASGSRMFDIDGNEYVDYVLGFGPMLLGHNPPEVIEAVTDQLTRGFTFGAQHTLEAEVAERVIDAVPCAELVCFSTTGSEAVHAALRIARAATGRPKVIKFEGHYHGWLDPMGTSTPGLPPADRNAVPPLVPVPSTDGQTDASDVVLIARWNDADGLAGLLELHGDEVAAVIMEPVAANGGLIAPLDGYLERARELTSASGSLLDPRRGRHRLSPCPGRCSGTLRRHARSRHLRQGDRGGDAAQRGRRKRRGDEGRRRRPRATRRHL